MIVRVPIRQDPKGERAFLLDLPTYVLIGMDPVTMTATVQIPDEDAPPLAPPVGDAARPVTIIGPVLIALDQKQTDAWAEHLAVRYAGALGPIVARVE